MREAPIVRSAEHRDQTAVKLQAIHEALPIGLAFLDADLRCTDLNDRMAGMLGLSPGAQLGRTLWDALPGLEERLAPLLRGALEGASVEGIELVRAGSPQPIATPPAAPRVLVASFRPLRGEDGGVSGLLCTVQDLTEQRRIEAALRESEDHYRQTVEMSPLLPWSCDPEGRSLELSPRWRDRMGMSFEDAVGTGWQRALHPDDAGALRERWSHALRTGDSFDLEARFRVADGSYRWFRCRASARRDAHGRIVRWFGNDEDIHDRKTAEAALRESEDHYRHSVELNPQYPFIADADGMLLEISSRWRELVGMTHEETLGFGWARAVHPDDVAGVQRNWAEALGTGSRPDHEKRFRLADGSYRWFRGRATPRRDAEGRIVRWYGSTEDIHDRKMTEAALRESEAFARQVLDSNPECMKVLDLDGRILFMSGPGQRLLEIEDFACVEGKLWERIWPPASRKLVRAAIDAAKEGRTGRFIGRCPTATGKEKWWDNLLCPLHGGDGRPERLLAISRDITETQLAREALEKSAMRLSAVLESTTDGVIFVDRDWRITYANRRAAELHRAQGVSLGDRLFDVFPDEGGCFEGPFRKAMREQVPVAFEEYLPAREAWLEVHAFPTAEGLSIFFRDVTGRRRAEQERLLAQAKIEHLARYDALTGLPNRLFFQERLEETLRGPGKARLAIHYLDLDQFKAVNDTLGHPAGDALLRQVATRLRRCAGITDMVARFGGDEFAIVQTALEQPDDASALARCIVQALGEPFEVDGAQILTGTSIGIALAQSDGGSVDGLMKAADIALYRAKAAGRGTYRFFAPWMAEELQAYHGLKLGLRKALARGEFELHYQPLVNLGSGRISGFEALLRWRHPERGLVSPAEFIPVAEETGLIVEIGEWVLREACREATCWPDGIGVSVNLSSVQFRGKGLVDRVAQVLAETRLAPGRLELEITESVLLQDNEANLAVLRQFRRLGVRIAMDDFGTGYSALGYLRCFPFSKIKIDRSFVGDLPHAESSKAIMRAIAGLGHSLGITTTAEGVETLQQLAAVRAQGCQEVQGYVFSKPVPAAEIPAVFQRVAWMGLIDPGREEPPAVPIHRGPYEPCGAPFPQVPDKAPRNGGG